MQMTYLYYIAIISTSYVGFTSFFLALRQIVGARIDRAAGWLMRYLIAGAFCITTTALMPPLLSLFSTDLRTSVRVSSLIALILLGRLDYVYLRIRSSILREAMDSRMWLLFAAAVLTDLVFASVASGMFPGDQFALFCLAESLELVVMFQYFLKSLESLMRDRPGPASVADAHGATLEA